MSKIDVIYAYYCGILRMYKVGDFAYVISSAAEDNCIIICINLVLPMEWVESLKYFCAFSETLTDVYNTLLHTSLTITGYGDISKIPETGLGPPHTLDSLTHIYCYMYDVITVVHGIPDQQLQVFDCTVQAFKRIFPYFPGETKDSVRVNELKVGVGDWTYVKEFLVWTIDT